MNKKKPYGFLCSDEHYEAARRIATEGIVLLKNEGLPNPSQRGAKTSVLPLDPTKMKRILVVGENAIKMMTVGGGSSSLKAQHEILPLDGIDAYLRHQGNHNYQFSIVNSQLDYARGYVGDTIQSYNGVTVGRSLYETRTQAELTAEAVEKARQADVVIFFGGLNKSDFQDCEGHDRKQFELPYGQNELIEALVAVNPRLVYVNISGNAVAMPWTDKVPAIVQAWFLGSETGTAIASVLFGDVNPSGKLPFTWYADLSQCGAHALNAYPGTWRTDHQVIDEEYKEDIFVGYRWTDLPAKVKKEKLRSTLPLHSAKNPLFPFGHGKSYTTFKLGKLTADRKQLTADEKITFHIDVTNTGSRTGAETVQLYISDKKASVERPVKELKAFRKVFLQPGETKQVSFTIDRSALSFYDEQTSSWKAEPGEFEALAGTSAADIASRLAFNYQ